MTYILSSLKQLLPQNRTCVLSYRFIKGCAIYRQKNYETDSKTTVSILNSDPEAGLLIDSYSQLGFRLNNGMSVIGPMAIFPKTVLSWNVASVEEINEESLSLFYCLEPKIDILVLGVGDNKANTKLNRNVVQFMRKYRINVETLPTEQACATFNFLNAEKRYVAAALIPPETLRPTEDDIALTKIRMKNIFVQDQRET